MPKSRISRFSPYKIWQDDGKMTF